ncbi:hypothetical protein SA2016_2274 [Sinomonas atrocyanea]|uniref:Uncharacterized protein n=1 Tax=Sinomonas atrocyanea TaxID=37927 RepID=A0A127A0V7_9MICC|nr:hypothetical protein [Sinomonas atrocyanea]AMM32943.1 hypothetical protein SA2016_2274 [Sinomonas atrocyanea]GEB65653.1 hypothetical protein SAT01_31010 [Sinomonas atrocyanea]GGG75468.1 hypothetical protein GCM10007172_30380 [Sinomonas atrocyanea]
MNSIQSSSEQFAQHLKSVGGSEADVSGSPYAVGEEDTVENVASGLRIGQQQRSEPAGRLAVLHAAAEVLISRRDEHRRDDHPGTSLSGQYQLDIHLSASRIFRVPIPETDLEAAKAWALGRIEAEGSDFGAIYFPSGGGDAPGTGALECRYDRAVGWYR